VLFYYGILQLYLHGFTPEVNEAKKSWAVSMLENSGKNTCPCHSGLHYSFPVAGLYLYITAMAAGCTKKAAFPTAFFLS